MSENGEWDENNVNHPNHYANGCSLECIDVMRLIFGGSMVRAFCLCSAFKYMWRYKFKNGIEDLEKARWYLDYIHIREDDSKEAKVLELYQKIVEKEGLVEEVVNAGD